MNKRIGPLIVVTGASRGIGLQIALGLARAGYNVIGSARETEHPARQEFEMLPLDVTNAESVSKFVTTIQSERGQIGVLVNNVGSMLYGAAEEISFDELMKQLELNFLGTVRMTQTVLPQMRRLGSGKIINISSLGGLVGTPFTSAYAASKFALEGYSESLRHEIRPFNIWVSLVEPGGAKTNSLDQSILLSQQEIDAYKQSAKLNRDSARELQSSKGVQPEDIVRTVRHIIEVKQPKLRYPVGRQARTIGWLKRIMPSTLFEPMVKRSFQFNY